MAGVSLTLFWLDDELERLWHAPADAPAFRRGTTDSAAATAQRRAHRRTRLSRPPRPPRRVAGQRRAVAALFAVTHRTIDANVDELGRIDAVAGDGDHGIGMQRGATAAAGGRGAAEPRRRGRHRAPRRRRLGRQGGRHLGRPVGSHPAHRSASRLGDDTRPAHRRRCRSRATPRGG